MSEENKWHGTTIISVRKNGNVIIMGDGQVSVGNTVMKSSARKVRKLGKSKVIAGFAALQKKREELPQRKHGVIPL